MAIWQTPKQDYNSTQQGVDADDFNRIEGNTQYLYDEKENSIGPKRTAFNKDYAGNGSADSTARSDHFHPSPPSEVPIGTIWMFGGTTPPSGWLICDGTELNRTVPPNQPLFDAIGNNFGGSIPTLTFKIPDMRQTIPIGTGGAAAPNVGDNYGSPTATLEESNIPEHSHKVLDSTNQNLGDYHASVQIDGGNGVYVDSISITNTSNTGTGIGNYGGVNGVTQAFEIMQPSLTVNFIIKRE